MPIGVKPLDSGRESCYDTRMSELSHAPYRTDDFLVLLEPQTGAVEVWVDWVPAVDGMPGQPILARMEEENLLVTVPGDPDERGQPRPTREVVGLNPEVRQALTDKGLVWVVCGPSGILGRRAAQLDS